MSRESLEQFRAAYVKYSTLQDRLKATANQASFVSLAVKLAEESGYDFTAEEVEALILEEARNQGIDALTVENALEQFRTAEAVGW